MPNRNYERGAALERAWCADKERDGYVTFRVAGSRGATDCIAAHPGDLIFAQCKQGGKYPFDGFGPSDRQRLAAEAAQANARAVLVRKLPRQRGYDEIPEQDWPQ